MKSKAKIAIVALLAVVIGAVVVAKRAAVPANRAGDQSASQPTALPRLVDLGSDKCIPCKMMAPILAELKSEWAGRVRIEFIDVWADPQAGEQYGVSVIPTQIFYDAAGKELSRHEGFMTKADIVERLRAYGIQPADEAR